MESRIVSIKKPEMLTLRKYYPGWKSVNISSSFVYDATLTDVKCWRFFSFSIHSAIQVPQMCSGLGIEH